MTQKPKLPTGTVTFLFTDIEGSTRLIQDLGDTVFNRVFAEHRRLLMEAVDSAGGAVYQDQGESFVFVFSRAKDAVLGAVAAQRALLNHDWPDGGHLRVRMGLHSGEPVASGDEYVGLDVHRASRICSAGHGGQILLSLATRELVADDVQTELGFRDLGEHRLKDLTRAQRLFQIITSDLSTDFPALRTLDVLPNNLPAQLTSFIGREREIAEIKPLLFGTRLLTLTGSGGAGKTRLALQVAAEMLEEFKDGVWLVELASLSDPGLVAKEVASAMNIPEQPGRPLSKTLEDYLRARSPLLLLDNCEHLVSGCAELTETLLRACPNLRVLATSREALDIEGERAFRVPSLSLPDTVTPSLGQLTQYEAIRMFIDRATAALPSFVVTEQNAIAVATICRQLDGIPLAIELAAPKVRSLSVEHIAERLRDRFGLLTSGMRTALPRQQTLRATMDWSYDLLSEPERVLLRRLSVFAGGFTLEAAEAVCQGPGVEAAEVVDLLTHLVEKSLVAFQEREGRYRLLETVRQYGREKLQELAEESGTRGRHRDWFTELAEQAEPKLRGAQQKAWLDRLEVEHDNLRAALECSRRDEDAREVGLRLAGALHWFWFLRGHWAEARRWSEGVLPGNLYTPSIALAKALQGAAHFVWRQNENAKAKAFCEQALVLSRELGSTELIVWSLCFLGGVVSQEGNRGQARAIFDNSVGLARQLPEKWLLAFALSQVGFMEVLLGDFGRSAVHLEQSLALSRETGDQWLIAYCLRLASTVPFRLNDYKSAEAYLKESLALCKEGGHKWVAELSLSGLAAIASAHGHLEQAAQLFGAVETLRESLGVHHRSSFQDHYARQMASARVGLGEKAFEAASAEGRAMTLERAIECALSE